MLLEPAHRYTEASRPYNEDTVWIFGGKRRPAAILTLGFKPRAQPQPSLWMSMLKAAWRRLNLPPRRSVIPPVQLVPRKVPATSGSRAQASR